MLGPVFELNIALVPESRLAQRHTALSQNLAARYPALVRLGEPARRLTLAPHLTMYQVPIPAAHLSEMSTRLSSIARGQNPQHLTAIGYAYNKREGSLEISYQTSHDLAAMQGLIIAQLNPLRGQLLLERDPAGNCLNDLREGSGASAANIAQTGYAEVGGAFRPHVTLNWFELDTEIQVADEPLLSDAPGMNGAFTAIGVFTLGPYGTCPQLLSCHKLEGR